jgi:hypothetical protein
MEPGGTDWLNRPLLVLAYPDDPVIIRFSEYAVSHGLQIWQPKHLEDLAWSCGLDSEVEIIDRVSGRRWQSYELAGIWYQASPPFTTLDGFEERDLSYISAEFNSAMLQMWHMARCVVIGQALAATNLIDFGLESRIELRRLGLPTLTDRIGNLRSLRSALGVTSPENVWITRAQGASMWLSDILAVDPPDIASALVDGELIASTATDNRQVCVAIHVDSDILVVEVQDGIARCTSPQDLCVTHVKSIVQTIRSLTNARVGVTYLGRQQERWKVARLSLQIPYWLSDTVASWLFPRLLRIFANSSQDHPDTGSIR